MAELYRVSRPTIYKALRLARLKLFNPQLSNNERYTTITYGIKRLAKVEKAIEDKLKQQAKRYNKSYPREIGARKYQTFTRRLAHQPMARLSE